MLDAKLVVVGGDAKAAEISLVLPTVIGRGRDANLTLPHPLVSRQHCELYEREGMLHVRDLKSLNGTYVDSQRIEASSVLQPDQLLTIGNVTFRAIYSATNGDARSVTDASKVAGTSNVIEIEQTASADSDSQVDPDVKELPLHSRPTVRGNNKTEDPAPDEKSDPVENVPEGDVGNESAAASTSDVLDDFADEESTPLPQHSIVAAMREAGVATGESDNATISDIRAQLPDALRPESSSIDGLVGDADANSSGPADFSSVDVEHQVAEKVEPDESALDSFIRKLPR